MGKYNWDNLKQTLQKGVDSKKEDFNDPREWKLQRDEDDNGTAIIRLLPGKGGDTPPVVRIFEHSVRIFNKQTNKYRYYIEPSPASIGLDCPVSEIYYELGDVGTEEAKKMQSTFSRSVKFISNILVVNDPANPENNGKIFYWKYGVKLFEKFQAALEPTEQQLKIGKKPIQLFDPEEGANIILEVKKAGGFINYDDTSIETVTSRAFETDEEMDEAVLEKCHDLTEFISEDYYKPYAELKKKIAWTLEKSPEEAYLISIGSKIISEPYSKRPRGQEATSESSSETAPVSTGGYTPKTRKVSEAEPAQVESTKEESKESAPAPKETVSKPTTSAADDDEILKMIDDL